MATPTAPVRQTRSMLRTTVVGPDGWERYRQIRLAALADAPDAFWSTTADEAEQPESFWRRRLEPTDRITVIAVVDGDDVGTMYAGPHHGGGPDAGVYAVWVAPGARGSGAAVAMLETVTAWARAQGYRRLRLDVGDHNAPAIAFYRRVGFVPTGVISRFPAPRDHITEHEMVLDL